MAETNNKPNRSSSRRILKIANGIQANMDSMYRNTYSSDPSIPKDLEDLNSQINKSINKISDDSKAMHGVSNISKLYNRVIDSGKTSAGKSFTDQVASMFEDGPLMDDLYTSFLNNYYLSEMDNEIDAICRYMPRLEEALETKKDNVLSADHFSKDFLTITSDLAEDQKLFKTEIDDIKREYDLLTFAEDLYTNAAKYGEQFVYVVPYKKALAKLLNKKGNTSTPPTANIKMESSGFYLTEGGSITADKSILVENQIILKDNEKINFNIEINRTGVIESVVRSRYEADMKGKIIKEQSIWNESSIEDKILKDTDITGSLSFEGIEDDSRETKIRDYTSADGMVDIKEKSIKVPGCILKVLDHANVCPIYIDDICMGYYYIEIIKDAASFGNGFTNMMADPMTASTVNAKTGTIFNNVEAGKQDDILRFLSGQLSQYIDKSFINNNQDLRREIYMILKHNDVFNSTSIDRMKVTFISPDEMEHVCFRRNSLTHRGVSDLDRAMVPAKMYCALYITNTIAYLTRGQDKRVYYVKQNVETNIAKTLMNVIQQIKQGNFGIRQFRSVNSVLNITGRFNDYVIPTNASGDAPIQMEVMQGQSVDLKTEMLEMLEEMAINSTDVPLELIQARMSMDYATHYTMSSIKFLRKAYKRQGQYQKFLSSIVTKIYNSEHEDKQMNVTVTLPPPIFLNITNTNQIIDNTSQYVDKIVEIDMASEPNNDDKEQLTASYKKALMEYHLGTYIDIEKNKIILNKVKMEIASKKNPDDNGGY